MSAFYITTRPYAATLVDEVSLMLDDKVQLIANDSEFGDGWYMGQNLRTNQIGLFPKEYVELITADSQQRPLLRSRTRTHRTMNSNPSSPSTPAKTSPVESSQLKKTLLDIDKVLYSIDNQQSINDYSSNASLNHLESDPEILSFLNRENQNIFKWPPSTVESFFKLRGFSSNICSKFLQHKISGKILLELELSDIKELDVEKFGDRFEIYKEIELLRDLTIKYSYTYSQQNPNNYDDENDNFRDPIQYNSSPVRSRFSMVTTSETFETPQDVDANPHMPSSPAAGWRRLSKELENLINQTDSQDGENICLTDVHDQQINYNEKPMNNNIDNPSIINVDSDSNINNSSFKTNTRENNTIVTSNRSTSNTNGNIKTLGAPINTFFNKMQMPPPLTTTTTTPKKLNDYNYNYNHNHNHNHNQRESIATIGTYYSCNNTSPSSNQNLKKSSNPSLKINTNLIYEDNLDEDESITPPQSSFLINNDGSTPNSDYSNNLNQPSLIKSSKPIDSYKINHTRSTSDISKDRNFEKINHMRGASLIGLKFDLSPTKNNHQRSRSVSPVRHSIPVPPKKQIQLSKNYPQSAKEKTRFNINELPNEILNSNSTSKSSLIRKKSLNLKKLNSKNINSSISNNKNTSSAFNKGLRIIKPMDAIKNSDFSGWMAKKGSGKITTWKNRFFTLHSTRLSYFTSLKDSKEKGLIDIIGHKVLPISSNENDNLLTNLASLNISHPYIFKLVPPSKGFKKGVCFTEPKTHYFGVSSQEEMRSWMKALMKVTIEVDESTSLTSCVTPTVSLAKAKEMLRKQREFELLNQPQYNNDFFNNNNSTNKIKEKESYGNETAKSSGTSLTPTGSNSIQSLTSGSNSQSIGSSSNLNNRSSTTHLFDTSQEISTPHLFSTPFGTTSSISSNSPTQTQVTKQLKINNDKTKSISSCTKLNSPTNTNMNGNTSTTSSINTTTSGSNSLKKTITTIDENEIPHAVIGTHVEVETRSEQ